MLVLLFSLSKVIKNFISYYEMIHFIINFNLYYCYFINSFNFIMSLCLNVVMQLLLAIKLFVTKKFMIEVLLAKII